MARRSLLSLLVLVSCLLLGGTHAQAEGKSRVNRQAWSQTGTVPIAAPQQGEIYVASEAGQEQARSYLHLDLAGIPVAELSAAKVTLTEGPDSLLAANAQIAACPITSPLPADGEITNPPTGDCSTVAFLSRSSKGTWSLALRPFVTAWHDTVENGLVLFPDAATATATFRVALSTNASKLVIPGAAPGPARSSRPPPLPSSGGAVQPNSQASPNAFASPGGTGRVPPSLSLTSPANDATPPLIAPPAADYRPAVQPQPYGGNATEVLVIMAAVCVATCATVVLAAKLRRRAKKPRRYAASMGAVGTGYWPIAIAAIGLTPMLMREDLVYKMGLVLIAFVAAVGLHILVNWAGELSLAQAAMVGLPGFGVLALSSTQGISPIYLLPLGVVIGAVLGAVIALPVLRAQGVQVALLTLVAGIALDRFFFAQTWLVGDVGGRTSAQPTLGPWHFSSSRSLYPVLLAAVLLAVLVAWALMHSKVYRAWTWVRDDPAAASAFGIPVPLYRISAYAAGGAFGGLAGSLTVMWIQSLGSGAFPDTLSLNYLVLAVLAGPGFVGGVAFATLNFQGGQQFADNIFGLDTGKVVNAILAYGSAVVLVRIIAKHSSGFNGVGRQFMKRIRSSSFARPQGTHGSDGTAPSLAFVSGCVAIVAGFVAIYLAWHHASGTDQVWIQNQEMLSGGFAGLGLILVGIGLLIRDRLARNQHEMVRQLDKLVRQGANGHRQAGREPELVEEFVSDWTHTDEIDEFVAGPAMDSQATKLLRPLRSVGRKSNARGSKPDTA